MHAPVTGNSIYVANYPKCMAQLLRIVASTLRSVRLLIVGDINNEITLMS